MGKAAGFALVSTLLCGAFSFFQLRTISISLNDGALRARKAHAEMPALSFQARFPRTDDLDSRSFSHRNCDKQTCPSEPGRFSIATRHDGRFAAFLESESSHNHSRSLSHQSKSSIPGDGRFYLRDSRTDHQACRLSALGGSVERTVYFRRCVSKHSIFSPGSQSFSLWSDGQSPGGHASETSGVQSCLNGQSKSSIRQPFGHGKEILQLKGVSCFAYITKHNHSVNA